VTAKVLVVDDEPALARALAINLRTHGWEVVLAGDGRSALEAASTHHPDVVLLDLGLPKMDGYEVARLLREEHGSRIQLVAITGYQKNSERLEEAGFDHHVIKPPDFPQLLEWLKRNGRGEEAYER
jgi:CheY-like chemotaxis protein